MNQSPQSLAMALTLIQNLILRNARPSTLLIQRDSRITRAEVLHPVEERTNQDPDNTLPRWRRKPTETTFFLSLRTLCVELFIIMIEVR